MTRLPRRRVLLSRWRRLAAICALSWGALLFQLGLFATTAFADDCQRDFRRAEDCLRTPGFAQGLGTGVATVITVIVNGVAISQTVIQHEGGDDGDEEEDTQYWLEIESEGYRTTLKTDGDDTLKISAWVECSKDDVDTYALTEGLYFAVDGPNADWVDLEDPQMDGGAKAVTATASPPSDDAELSEEPGPMVRISTEIEGRHVSGALQLRLEPEEYEMEFLDGVGG